MEWKYSNSDSSSSLSTRDLLFEWVSRWLESEVKRYLWYISSLFDFHSSFFRFPGLLLYIAEWSSSSELLFCINFGKRPQGFFSPSCGLNRGKILLFTHSLGTFSASYSHNFLFENAIITNIHAHSRQSMQIWLIYSYGDNDGYCILLKVISSMWCVHTHFSIEISEVLWENSQCYYSLLNWSIWQNWLMTGKTIDYVPDWCGWYYHRC